MGILSNFLSSGLSGLLSGLQAVGIGGYVAGARVKESVTKTSKVTQSVVEDGSTISDHIINNPVILQIEGDLGNVSAFSGNPHKSGRSSNSLLGVISSFLPTRTKVQVQKLSHTINTIDRVATDIGNALSGSGNIFDAFSPLLTKDEKQRFYQYFDGIYKNKILIDVEMPDKTYQNMAMTYFNVSEFGGNYLSYKFTFQEVRIAVTQSVDSSEFTKNPGDGTKSQTSKTAKKGTVSGSHAGDVSSKTSGASTSKPESLLHAVFGG